MTDRDEGREQLGSRAVQAAFVIALIVLFLTR